MAGIQDIMIKTHGTPNPWAIVEAFKKALHVESHQTTETIAWKRGKRVHDDIVSKRYI